MHQFTDSALEAPPRCWLEILLKQKTSNRSRQSLPNFPNGRPSFFACLSSKSTCPEYRASGISKNVRPRFAEIAFTGSLSTGVLRIVRSPALSMSWNRLRPEVHAQKLKRTLDKKGTRRCPAPNHSESRSASPAVKPRAHDSGKTIEFAMFFSRLSRAGLSKHRVLTANTEGRSLPTQASYSHQSLRCCQPVLRPLPFLVLEHPHGRL